MHDAFWIASVGSLPDGTAPSSARAVEPAERVVEPMADATIVQIAMADNAFRSTSGKSTGGNVVGPVECAEYVRLAGDYEFRAGLLPRVRP